MDPDDLLDWLRLARLAGLHSGAVGTLLDSGASPLALLREPERRLAEFGVAPAAARARREVDPADLQRDVAWLKGGERRRLVPWGSGDYPPLLARLEDAPLVLFAEGDPTALLVPQLAVVGSRNPTALGRDTATQFAAHLVRSGLGITSGLALGIDAAAHRGALLGGGRTVAVVGRGLDAIYPRENEPLARQILAGGGALVTDLPPGTPPLKQNFPRRNRLISGLSLGTLVVEAALQSGSLITARLASEQGREVFAIPGSIHSPLSRGCHRLIRAGARLVETVDDIFSELEPIVRSMGAILARNDAIEPVLEPPSLDKDYEILLDALGFEPASLDALVARTGLQADAVASMLLILELDGRVQQQPGGRYSRLLPGKV